MQAVDGMALLYQCSSIMLDEHFNMYNSILDAFLQSITRDFASRL